MKAALVRAPGQVEIVEMETPRPGPAEILVAMKSVVVCGSDVHPWYVASKAPAVLGHETAGVVAETGAGVAHLHAGDRVFVHHHVPCGACRYCEAGESVMCPAWKPSRLHPGGLAEYVRVEAPTVARDALLLPPHVSFTGGAFVEPVACALKAVDRAGVRAGDAALVVGLGSNGILLGWLARLAGAGLLVGSDPDPVRRRLALEHGFDVAVDPSAEPLAAAVCAAAPRGADAVFVVPTSAEAVLPAIEAAGPAGRVVFFSPVAPGAAWPIAPNVPYFKDLTLRFSYSSGPLETRRALDLISSGSLPVERLVTHRVPLARTGEAFALAQAGGEALKVVVEI
ncbi:MAG: alcohol dehydrogenase catalytic domain-containing protein [Thermoanaerobaculia bacterium]